MRSPTANPVALATLTVFEPMGRLPPTGSDIAARGTPPHAVSLDSTPPPPLKLSRVRPPPAAPAPLRIT